MKLQADRMEGQNAISRHGPDGIIVNGVEYRESVDRALARRGRRLGRR